MTIHIHHAEVEPARKASLAFMYSPVVYTLRQGFAHLGASPQLQVHEYDALLRVQHVHTGHIFLWVGVERAMEVPWPMLRARGVHTIYFQTEPRPMGCQFNHSLVDEIWDFARSNIAACARQPNAPRQRYVPLGYNPKTAQVVQRPLQRLEFFGEPTRYGRHACWAWLKNTSSVSRYLNAVYNIWNETAFTAYLRGAQGVFLNIHKGHTHGCNRVQGPVTFRNNILLGARGLILSEPCHPADEAEFEGLISFVPRNKIGFKFNELIAMTVLQRQKLADTRHAAFKARFDVSRIFTRASVADLLRANSLQGMNRRKYSARGSA